MIKYYRLLLVVKVSNYKRRKYAETPGTAASFVPPKTFVGAEA